MPLVLLPSTLLLFSAFVALAMLSLRLRGALLFAGLASVAFVFMAVSPLGNILFNRLDQRFPAGVYPSAKIEGIVVLAGSYGTEDNGQGTTIMLEEDTEPLAAVVHLAQRYPEAKIIISGGITDASTPPVSEASSLNHYFAGFGISPDRVIIEGRSVTIAQNARFAAQLLHPSASSRWLLVTSGYRMSRAAGAFRKVGFNVFPFPIQLRRRLTGTWEPGTSCEENIASLDRAVHEWLALAYYKLKGYSDRWFAGPEIPSLEGTPAPQRTALGWPTENL